MSDEQPIVFNAGGILQPEAPAPQIADSDAGIAHSFGSIYREHYGAIAGLIYRRTGSKHTTEDLTSDVFLEAYRAFPRFRGEVPVGVWLRRIAHHRVNRWVRREAGLRGILRRLPAIGWFLPDLSRSLDRPPALRALLSLSTDQQAILSAHYLEGMSLNETALMLSISPLAAKSRLARAREALRIALHKEEQP